jgi:hypothetical protein
MKLIGVKKKNIFVFYIIGLILGLFITFAGVMAVIKEDENPLLVILGAVVTIICIIYLIDIIKSPKEVIFIDLLNGFILLNNKKSKIYLKNIKNIRYKQARNKYKSLKWGNIYIEANDQIYKCKYVDNCEQVSYYIHEESVKAKNEFQ